MDKGIKKTSPKGEAFIYKKISGKTMLFRLIYL